MDHPSNEVQFAYVGCRTSVKRHARGKGISIYHIEKDGKWSLKEIVPAESPSFLALDHSKRFLYTVHGDTFDVSAYQILSDGSLRFLNTVSAQGKNPVYCVVSKNNKYLFVATLQGGTITTLPILSNGSLGDAVHIYHLEGLPEKGPSYAHQCELDCSGEYLLVPTQSRGVGYERVWVFKVDNKTGRLEKICVAAARKFDEPRHLAFSTDNRFVYLVNERGNSVRTFTFDSSNGMIHPIQVKQTLPETYVAPAMASEIVIRGDGKYTYVSNRVHEGMETTPEEAYAQQHEKETIVRFENDPKTGFLKNPVHVYCEGKTPRFMTITPDGRQLIVANMDSDALKFFDITIPSGIPHYTGQSIATGSPCSIVFC